MKHIVIVAILLATVLAGCSESAPPEMTPDDFEEKFEEIDVADDKGAIRGIVLTPTIVPITGATVKVLGSGETTVTNEDGAFIFKDMEPGTYFIQASRIGFNATQTGVQVEAGIRSPPIVKIVLQPDPTGLPFTELQQWEAYLQCGVGFGVIGLSTNPCAFTGSDNVHAFEVQKPLDMVQIEMFWEGTNIFGDTLSVGILRPGTISNFAGRDSGSPAIFRVLDEKLTEELGEEYTQYSVRVFPGTSSPVSIVAEQSMTIFSINFYGFVADEAWTFINDGPAPLPP